MNSKPENNNLERDPEMKLRSTRVVISLLSGDKLPARCITVLANGALGPSVDTGPQW